MSEQKEAKEEEGGDGDNGSDTRRVLCEEGFALVNGACDVRGEQGVQSRTRRSGGAVRES